MLRTTVSLLSVLIAISPATLARGEQATPVPSDGKQAAEEQAARQVTQSLVKALNSADAEQAPEKVAALFTSGAELIDDAGNVHKGVDAIKDLLGRFFEKFPGARSAITPDSVSIVGPGVAIEEGHRVVTTKDGRSSASTHYTLVIVKQEGQWKIASVRESEDDTNLTPHDHLEPLSWLVGDWVDESSDAVIEISCKWSEDKNYLLVDFLAKTRGKPTLKS